MKTIMHPDYWVEIPAGEFLTGLSDQQRELLQARFQQHLRKLPWFKKRTLLSVIKRREYGLQGAPGPKSSEFTEKEWRLVEAYYRHASIKLADLPRLKLSMLRLFLDDVPVQRSVWLDRFYIARFPVTSHQYHEFTHGAKAHDLPGVFEEPETIVLEIEGRMKEVYYRRVATVRIDESRKLLEELGARFPTNLEWEKAARGTDGRLYPWGNQWDPEAGFFYYGQKIYGSYPDREEMVTGFPRGVSPYGVWAMAGSLPELVTLSSATHRFVGVQEYGSSKQDQLERLHTLRHLPTFSARYWIDRPDGSKVFIDVKGHHPRESSPEMAWLDHVTALPGTGDWVSLRPVLDQWPVQQWPGFRAGEEQREQPESTNG